MAVIHWHRGQHPHWRQIRELDAKVLQHTAFVHQLFDVEVVVHRTPWWLTRGFAVSCVHDLFCIMTKLGFRRTYGYPPYRRSAAASVSEDFTSSRPRGVRRSAGRKSHVKKRSVYRMSWCSYPAPATARESRRLSSTTSSNGSPDIMPLTGRASSKVTLLSSTTIPPLSSLTRRAARAIDCGRLPRTSKWVVVL